MILLTPLVFMLLVLVAYLMPDKAGWFAAIINIDSFFIVFGGLFFSSLLFIPLSDYSGLVRLFYKLVFNRFKFDTNSLINTITEISKQAQMVGKHRINIDSYKKNPFLYLAFSLVVEHMDKEFIRKTLENSIYEMRKRHFKAIGYFQTLGSFAPMFGLMGTVIGIINVLRNMSDPSSLGMSMALALITTLYGLLSASLFFLPLAKALEVLSDKEFQLNEMIMEGAILIEEEEAPSRVEHFLRTYEKTISARKVK